MTAADPPAAGRPCAACGTVADDGNFCEECGSPLVAEAKGAGASQRAPASEERTAPGSRPSDAEAERDRTGDAAVASRPRTWVAVVSADRKLFDALGAAARGFAFPSLADRRVALTADRVRIGRSGRTGPAPDVDLCGPPPDPGVSREHAELRRRADGGWVVRDGGSANGTYLGSRRLAAGELAPVTAPIRLGVWSRITLVEDG